MTERTLDVVQQWFQAVITHPGGVARGAADAAAQELIRLNRGELEAVVRRSRNLTAEERLSIYANAYWARLLEVLADVFPVLRTALGEDVFEGFACEYLQRHPSQSYTLDHLGERFPQFLSATRPDREGGAEEVSWPDFLIDLAHLELTIAKVFDGPGNEGEPLLTADDLRALAPEDFAAARLVPAASLRLLACRYPVNAYYTAVRHAAAGEEVPLPEPGEERVAILRRDFVVRRYALTRPQHALLAAVLAGAPVAAALAAAGAASELEDEALAAELQAWFRLWTAEGFFQAVR